MPQSPLETSVDELAAMCARQFDAIQRTMVTREDLASLNQEMDALRVTTAEESTRSRAPVSMQSE